MGYSFLYSRKFFLIIIISIWFLILIFTLQMRNVYLQKKHDSNRISLANTDTVDLTSSVAGSEFLLSGVLGGDVKIIEGRLGSYARDLNLIIYAVETWDISRSDADSELSGSWITDHPIFPMIINLSGIDIKVQCAEDCYLIDEGPVVSQIIQSKSWLSVDGIGEGSQRIQGYPEGSQVTVFGRRAAGSPTLIVESIAMSAEEIEANYRFGYRFQLITTWIFAGVLILMLILIFFLIKEWNIRKN